MERVTGYPVKGRAEFPDFVIFAGEYFLPFLVNEPEFIFSFGGRNARGVECPDFLVKKRNDDFVGKGDVAVAVLLPGFDDRVTGNGPDFIVNAGHQFFSFRGYDPVKSLGGDFRQPVFKGFGRFVFQGDDNVARGVDVPEFVSHSHGGQGFAEIVGVVEFVGDDVLASLVDVTPFPVGQLMGVTREMLVFA